MDAGADWLCDGALMMLPRHVGGQSTARTSAKQTALHLAIIGGVKTTPPFPKNKQTSKKNRKNHTEPLDVLGAMEAALSLLC